MKKTVKTQDGVVVEQGSDKYKGHIFYDADGVGYKCLGYNPTFDDCVYKNVKTGVEVVGCMSGFYFNKPKVSNREKELAEFVNVSFKNGGRIYGLLQDGKFVGYKLTKEEVTALKEKLQKENPKSVFLFAKAGKTNVSKMFKEGGGTGFDEKEFWKQAEKKRLALDQAIKFALIEHVGFDKAVKLFKEMNGRAYRFVERAVDHNLVRLSEVNERFVLSAILEANEVEEMYRDSGQGISSSDNSAFLMNVLNGAGYKADFVNNKLERVDANGNVIKIKNEYPMDLMFGRKDGEGYKRGGNTKSKSDYLTGVYLRTYKTEKPDGTIVGWDADEGEMVAFKGRIISLDEYPKGEKMGTGGNTKTWEYSIGGL